MKITATCTNPCYYISTHVVTSSHEMANNARHEHAEVRIELTMPVWELSGCHLTDRETLNWECTTYSSHLWSPVKLKPRNQTILPSVRFSSPRSSWRMLCRATAKSAPCTPMKGRGCVNFSRVWQQIEQAQLYRHILCVCAVYVYAIYVYTYIIQRIDAYILCMHWMCTHRE